MSTPEDRKQEVLKVLSTIMDPDLGRNIVELGFIKDLTITGDDVAFKIELTTPACPVKDMLKKEAETKLAGLGWPKGVAVEMTAQVRAAVNQTEQLKIKNIIAVASGKGGVGKSTVSVNLAFALKQSGASVGILDSDIYGPSVPHMLGLGATKPQTTQVDGKMRLLPVEKEGVKIMSMGFLVEPEKAVIWRGPMIHGALKQFFGEVAWGELDYLVIDLPPGTGDAQLTMVQTVPVTGAVIVSTPQDVAMIDARKALNMFRDTNVPVLGIVENMSGYVCPSCGHESHIFGHDGARKWAEESGIKFLGHIPLNVGVRIHGDDGTPAVIAEDTDDTIRTAFRNAAEQTAAEISKNQLSKPAAKSLEIS